MGDEENHLSVFYQINCYLEDKKGMVQPTIETMIRTMKKHLISFEDYIGHNLCS